MAAVEVRDLRIAYGDNQVLDGVNLTVQEGSIVALLGPNGAGKTTLINILSTLVVPDSGTARVAGHDVVADPAAVRQAISVTGQSASVDLVLTGRENLVMMARLSGLTAAEAKATTRRLLSQFELDDAANRRVKTYSGGMRRRLDLALSLITTPRIIFLDEPTTGLDTRSRLALWDIIAALAASGVTILLTTQYLEEADRLADRIVLINRGVVAAEGTPAELKARVGGEVVELRASDDSLICDIAVDGSITSLLSALADLSTRAQDGSAIVLRKPTLDDAFLLLTADTQDPQSDLAPSGRAA
jgi:ABC-2 type transport system ATP-binding protein